MSYSRFLISPATTLLSDFFQEFLVRLQKTPRAKSGFPDTTAGICLAK
jgi:hypothetical protein